MEQKETVKDRLMRFLRHEGITNSEFARGMGLSMAYVSSMRKSMPEEKIERLMELYPRLNRDWLLYGEGEMYRDVPEKRRSLLPMDEYVVPLVPVDAMAGRLSMFSEEIDINDCEQVISPVRDVDFAIKVSGDSMEPEIPDGTVIFIKRINDRLFIPWGHPLVVDTENGTLLKMLYPSDEDSSCVEAKSYNAKYPPFLVPKDSIYGIYRIMGQFKSARIL